MKTEKYGIATYDEDNGYAFYWGTSTSIYQFDTDEQPDKEQVIEEFEDNLDALVELGYSAKDIHVFIDELKDEKNGDEAYKNLCLNVSYLKHLEERARLMPESIRKRFYKFLWRWKNEPERGDDHVAVLPLGFDFVDLLEKEEDFKRKISRCCSRWHSDYADAIKPIVEEQDVAGYLTNVILELSMKLDRKIRSAEVEIICIRRKFEELKGVELDPNAKAAFERIRKNIETIEKYRYADENAGKK